MSETGSAPAAAEGSGGNGSGDQTGDPGKTGAVQEVARNEAMLRRLPPDMIGLICDQLDQKSRLAILSVNKASNAIPTVRRKVEEYEKAAQDRVANSLAAAGSLQEYRNNLPGLLSTIHNNRYDNEDRDEGTTDFTGYVNQYLGRTAVEPSDLINFVSSLHISAQAACRLNANYKGLFEGMIHQSVDHVDKLWDRKIISDTEFTRLGIIKGQLETIKQKLHDIRTIGDTSRTQQPPKR